MKTASYFSFGMGFSMGGMFRELEDVKALEI